MYKINDKQCEKNKQNSTVDLRAYKISAIHSGAISTFTVLDVDHATPNNHLGNTFH
jgi:hypothetical protein